LVTVQDLFTGVTEYDIEGSFSMPKM